MRGERLGPAHQDALAPILADPRVAATMGGVASAAEVAEQLASSAERWDREGFGYWMFFDAVSGEPLARGGLSQQPEVEVGWRVTPERWGQGLASELGFVYEKTAAYKIYGDHVLYRRQRGGGRTRAA